MRLIIGKCQTVTLQTLKKRLIYVPEFKSWECKIILAHNWISRVEVNTQWKIDQPIYPHFIETTSEGYAHCTVYRDTNWEYQTSTIATTSRCYAHIAQCTEIYMKSIRWVLQQLLEIMHSIQRYKWRVSEEYLWRRRKRTCPDCSPSISWQWEEAHSRTDLSAILRRIRELILSRHHERLTWTPTRIPA
jgi:hypothetical protein